MKRAPLLFEVGCEELPSDYIEPARRQLTDLAAAGLRAVALDYDGVVVEATPRRLSLHVDGLVEGQPARVEDRLGQRRDQALNAEGEWTPAGKGFLRKAGVSPAEATFRDDRLYVRREIPGRPVTDLLPGLLAEWVRRLRFPKSMRWEASAFRFARPIRWLLALWDGQIVPVSLAGLEAGRTTRLHPMNTPKTAAVSNPDAYHGLLASGRVVLAVAARRERIRALLADAAAASRGRLLGDEALVERVTMMTEYPRVAAGAFQPAFLHMPREVVITAMREHQRYFAIEDAAGTLLPCFLAVYDNPQADAQDVRPGCERVLEARLKDAEFFFQEDLKRPLRERVAELKSVLWVKGLGTLLDKTRRLERLAARLTERLDPGAAAATAAAAHLAKADLVTLMVQEKEFSSLQGIMGGIYAAAQGEPAEVAEAIRAQYQPRGADDVPPPTPAGRILALADKFDHLVGCWGAGLAPTGAKDPYALRRAAQGILAILFAGSYRLSLTWVLEQVRGGYEQFADRREALIAETKRFLLGRLESELAARQTAPDVIQAVMGVWTDDCVDAWQRARTLSELRDADGFQGAVTTFSRVVNILPKDTPRDLPPGAEMPPVDPGRFQHDVERDWFDDLERSRPRVEAMAAAGAYADLFAHFRERSPLIDRFFDDVLVMDRDPAVRANRLHLLTRQARQFWRMADFSRLAGGA